MKIEIGSSFAFMLTEIAKGNNQEIEEYIEELILSEYQKQRLLKRREIFTYSKKIILGCNIKVLKGYSFMS